MPDWSLCQLEGMTPLLFDRYSQVLRAAQTLCHGMARILSESHARLRYASIAARMPPECRFEASWSQCGETCDSSDVGIGGGEVGIVVEQCSEAFYGLRLLRQPKAVSSYLKHLQSVNRVPEDFQGIRD